MAKGNGMNPCARPASHFRVPVTIEYEKDATGLAGAMKVWTLYARAMANVQTLNGADQWRSGQFTSESRWMVEIRWIPGVKANMRVVTDDGRQMQIVSLPVDVGERKRLLQLQCLELAGK